MKTGNITVSYKKGKRVKKTIPLNRSHSSKEKAKEKTIIILVLTLGRTKGWGVDAPSGFFYFFKRILSGHLSISVAVRLSLKHISCEFGENRHRHIGNIT